MHLDEIKEELNKYFADVNAWKLASQDEITKDVNAYCTGAMVGGDIDNYQIIWTPLAASKRITVTVFKGGMTRSFYCVFDYLTIKPLKHIYDDYDRAMRGIK